MENAEIVTSWTAGKQPQVALDYALEECNDVTAQQGVVPDPNAYVVSVRASTAVLDQIDADGWPILWREVIPEMPI